MTQTSSCLGGMTRRVVASERRTPKPWGDDSGVRSGRRLLDTTADASTSTGAQAGKRYGVTLHPGAERRLQWFFGPGQNVFARSTFGAQLELAKLFARSTRQCKRCRGTGFDKNDNSCAGCRGMGFVVVNRRKGQSDESKLDARPKVQQRESEGYEPDHFELIRFADVARSLQLVQQKQPGAVVVLSVFWGDEGARWATTEHGRYLSLYPLTEAGRRLLTIEKSEIELRECERFAALKVLQTKQPKDRRGALLTEAGRQSRQLNGESNKLWNWADGLRNGASEERAASEDWRQQWARMRRRVKVRNG